jgi:hypothetical protein
MRLLQHSDADENKPHEDQVEKQGHYQQKKNCFSV